MTSKTQSYLFWVLIAVCGIIGGFASSRAQSPVNGQGSNVTGGGGAPAGANTQLQYNNNGAFGGIAPLTWNNSTSALTLDVHALNGNFTMIGAASRQVFKLDGSINQVTIGNSTDNSTVIIFGDISIRTTAFASLGAVPAAGTYRYCTDCTTAATCAGSGSGHLAVSNGTNWTCQ